ncbi:hypothetical protein [Deinococcus sp.]|uniref:hypothetical protein n=1 Tax=Deinococcus sp. TaxID=47478 RepID=UPI002869E20E|nr:hypothetical protein [Deinococcus sp.]
MASLPRSALARPLDLTYPSNRVAALGMLAALLIARRQGRTWAQAADVAGTCFLAWATARELDPDVPMTANLALPVAFVAHPGTAGGALAGFGLLSAARLLAGTTGETPMGSDHVAMLAQAGLSARFGSHVAALLPALAPLAAGGGASGAVSVLGLLVPAAPAARANGSLLPLFAALLVGPALIAPEDITSECDRAPRTVRVQDVRRARIAALGVLGLGLVTRRPGGLVPLACAALVVGLHRAAAR